MKKKNRRGEVIKNYDFPHARPFAIKVAAMKIKMDEIQRIDADERFVV